MAEDSGKEDGPKLKFDSAGQAIAYISLDQARVRAIEHARDNRDVYDRLYPRGESAWEEVSAETQLRLRP